MFYIRLHCIIIISLYYFKNCIFILIQPLAAACQNDDKLCAEISLIFLTRRCGQVSRDNSHRHTPLPRSNFLGRSIVRSIPRFRGSLSCVCPHRHRVILLEAAKSLYNVAGTTVVRRSYVDRLRLSFDDGSQSL